MKDQTNSRAFQGKQTLQIRSTPSLMQVNPGLNNSAQLHHSNEAHARSGSNPPPASNLQPINAKSMTTLQPSAGGNSYSADQHQRSHSQGHQGNHHNNTPGMGSQQNSGPNGPGLPADHYAAQTQPISHHQQLKANQMIHGGSEVIRNVSRNNGRSSSYAQQQQELASSQVVGQPQNRRSDQQVENSKILLADKPKSRGNQSNGGSGGSTASVNKRNSSKIDGKSDHHPSPQQNPAVMPIQSSSSSKAHYQQSLHGNTNMFPSIGNNPAATHSSPYQTNEIGSGGHSSQSNHHLYQSNSQSQSSSSQNPRSFIQRSMSQQQNHSQNQNRQPYHTNFNSTADSQSNTYEANSAIPVGMKQTRAKSEEPNASGGPGQPPVMLIMRTVKESPKKNIKQKRNNPQDQILKQQIAKLVQRNQAQQSTTLPFFQVSKTSTKAFGGVRSFAANTNVGTVRKVNEDRIAIILNVIQPEKKGARVANWPKIQIFGVFDGHGGHKCAEYLKDNLHNNIIMNPDFPANIQNAITAGCKQTEEDFIKNVAMGTNQQPANKAGSCALIVFLVNEDVYVCNVGDSRALTSRSQLEGHSYVSHVSQMTRDHKPSDVHEFRRIIQSGGYIYQTQTVMKQGMPTSQVQQVRVFEPPEDDSDEEENPFVGPYRVFPGRLSVCRTFGDCEAKIVSFGGIPGCVVCTPDVHFEPNGSQSLDYILIGSDGIFDKMKNDQINQIVWDIATFQRSKHLTIPNTQPATLHQICGLIADEIIQQAARNRSLDNLSVVFIAFKRFQDYIEQGISLQAPGQGASAANNSHANQLIAQSQQAYSNQFLAGSTSGASNAHSHGIQSYLNSTDNRVGVIKSNASLQNSNNTPSRSQQNSNKYTPEPSGGSKMHSQEYHHAVRGSEQNNPTNSSGGNNRKRLLSQNNQGEGVMLYGSTSQTQHGSSSDIQSMGLQGSSFSSTSNGGDQHYSNNMRHHQKSSTSSLRQHNHGVGSSGQQNPYELDRPHSRSKQARSETPTRQTPNGSANGSKSSQQLPPMTKSISGAILENQNSKNSKEKAAYNQIFARQSDKMSTNAMNSNSHQNDRDRDMAFQFAKKSSNSSQGGSYPKKIVNKSKKQSIVSITK